MFSKWIFPDNWTVLVIAICSVLHQRSARRLSIIIAGIVFARGRRTVTSWFRAAGITKQYKAFYYFIGSIGRKTETIATILFEIMINLIYRKNDVTVQAFLCELLCSTESVLQVRLGMDGSLLECCP